MSRRTILLIVCVLFSAGCGDDKTAGNGAGPIGGGYGYGGYGQPNPAQTQFNDNATTNGDVNVPLTEMKFSDLDGQPKQLQDLLGERNLVVVLVRGKAIEGGVPCPYCSTQTSRLITNYDKFKERNAEVVVIYPLAAGRNKNELPQFLKHSKQQLQQPGAETPFPVWLDIDLAVVNQLGLQAELAKPTTYILDKQGRVRFAYVGAHMADRPSIKAMLAQLDSLK